jgi:hypothetical protein
MSEFQLTLDPSSATLIKDAYAAFNARNLEAALATMQPNVEWPNGMEGGTVLGHNGVREYWTRQWAVLDPHVDPVEITADKQGRIVVSVHQVVRDLNGSILVDHTVNHIYCLDCGLIRCMEISE